MWNTSYKKDMKKGLLLSTIIVVITGGIILSTYLINEDGVIEKTFEKVKAADNPKQMLDELNG